MHYITSHTAVWERVLFCCAAFEVTAYVRKRSARLEFKGAGDAEQIHIECQQTTIAGWWWGVYKQRGEKAVCVCEFALRLQRL